MHGHVNKVAHLCRQFAEAMFPTEAPHREWVRRWAEQVGWWHDLGKFAPDWQAYLRRNVEADIHGMDISGGKLDHSTAGAKHIAEQNVFGPLFAYLIAGHHSGLGDGVPLFHERFKKELAAWEDTARACQMPLEFVPPDLKSAPRLDVYSYTVLARMLFSCLVDADYLATEAYMDRDKWKSRPTFPDDMLARMEEVLTAYYAWFSTPAPGDIVNQQRAGVKQACLDAAALAPGFFSLTVPTGGGKTLASLAFALAHARKHGLRRVIYVIPYTSIIEQNANVFREVFASLGAEVVLEHHSNFEPRDDATNTRNRLMAENWDAPLVVTTNVQFFESLFAHKPGKCRKLHRIARSVVIFDEVQSLPVNLLSPILKSLQCLVDNFGVSAVLCTATQPALTKREKFEPGIPPEKIREIVPDRQQLFSVLKRVATKNLGKVTSDELCDRVVAEGNEGALLIVNTTKAAREICEKLRNRGQPVRHLSARMCPVHREAVLREIKAAKSPQVLVSTKLIEAGVDISFPVMFRAECGLDSFAQSAGRCNRNGELKDALGNPRLGQAYYGELTDYPVPASLRDVALGAGIMPQIIHLHGNDLLGLEAVERFFRLAIWQQGDATNKWDAGKDRVSILACFNRSGAKAMETLEFRKASEAFQLIDSPTQPVIIPWGEAGEQLRRDVIDAHKYGRLPHGALYRLAQRHAVNVYPQELAELKPRLESYFDGAFTFLGNPKGGYDEITGLIPASDQERSQGYIV